MTVRAVLFDMGGTLTYRAGGLAWRFPETKETLRRLRAAGLALAIVSNVALPGWWFEWRLLRLGIRKFFDVRVWSSDFGKEKPHPDIFHAALSSLGVPAEHAVFIGNSPEHDIAGAQAVGLRAALVDRDGTTVLSDAIVPDWIVRDLREFADIVLALQ